MILSIGAIFYSDSGGNNRTVEFPELIKSAPMAVPCKKSASTMEIFVF